MQRRDRTHPNRPPRLESLFDNQSAFYFVTFNTARRQPTLACTGVHEIFISFCRQAVDHGVVVGRYVIMPDHIHFFVARNTFAPGLSAWVRALRTVLGKQLLNQGNPKPHWQQGFFDHVL